MVLRQYKGHNWVIFGLALALSVIGLLFIFDAGYARSILANHGVIPREFRAQLIFLVASLVAYFGCTRIPLLTWQRTFKFVFWLTFAAVILVEFPGIGIEMNGAKRWIGVSFFTIQPAEFMKVAVILYLAGIFAYRKPFKSPTQKTQNWGEWLDYRFFPKFKRALPALWILIAAYMIEREPDLGTAAVILVISFVLFFLGGTSRKSILTALAVGGVGIVFLVTMEPYRVERILHHSDRWSAGMIDDLGYQTTQSETAMAGGRLLGVGIGSGRAKHMLPAATTDFILATIGEEFGLVGVLVMITGLGGLAYYLVVLGINSQNRFAQLVLFGSAAWIGIQSSVNIMMANGTLPAIGIPLPFISSGGSSLLSLWICLGICQSMLKGAKDPGYKQRNEHI